MPPPPAVIDRATFLRNLRISKLLTNQQYYLILEKLGNVQDTREIAKALATWKLITKFQARLLLHGRTTRFFLGPYRILDQLGQGGMGRVYRAMHQTMNRVVALKVLAPQVVNSDRALELFAREVQAAALLSHPNIVMAYDANEIDGRHYLAMEYIDGPNLERHVRDRGPLPVGIACEIVFQAANGLQHAHEKGMVHRDIKPANLLLQQDANSEAFQVKILDFGLARLNQPDQQSAADQSIVGPEKTVMGTPDFLSPEQSRSLHDVDIRADLYSLGCTFYYLLTAQVPFPDESIVKKVLRHNTELAEPIEDIRPDVPAKIGSIVRKLMAKNPADRFQTPDELMDALAPFAAPAVVDWTVSLPASTKSSPDFSSEGHATLSDVQVDTEPHAQSSTHINDEDSILDWVDANRKQKRFGRLILIASIAALSVALLAGSGLLWWFMQQDL